jgi:hypothetical protein
MAVYVDDWRQRATVGSLRDRVWCHLFVGPEDEIGELHEFAASIGLRRAWYQGPPKNPWPRSHYDVTEARRADAVQAGAVEITWREGGRMRMAGRARRYARSVELAEANGHEINVGEFKMECRWCMLLAIRQNLCYGLATRRPCPGPRERPWGGPPDDPAALVSPGHMAAVHWNQPGRVTAAR